MNGIPKNLDSSGGHFVDPTILEHIGRSGMSKHGDSSDRNRQAARES